MGSPVYYLDTHHKTKLGLKDGVLGHAESVTNRICLLKIDEHNALLVPESNLELLERGEDCGDAWAYDASADRGAIHLVKYFEGDAGSIRILSFSPRLHYSAPKPLSSGEFTLMETRTAHAGCCQKFYPVIAPDRDPINCEWLTSLGEYFKKGALSSRDFGAYSMCRAVLAQLLDMREFQKLGIESNMIGSAEDVGFIDEDHGAALEQLDVNSDWLESEYHNFRQRYGSGTIQHAVRAGKKPQYDCCVACIARRDGLYLAEFVAWYRALGFDGIIIYSIDESDGSEELLKALCKAGYIKWIHVTNGPGTNPQFKALAHFSGYNPFVLRHKFALCVDPGELLWIDTELFSDVKELIAYHELLGSGSIALSRIHVGSNRRVSYDERPFVERFPVASASADYNIKHFYRPHLAGSMQIHFPIAASGQEILIRHPDGSRYSNWEQRKHGPYALAFSDKRPLTHALLYNFYHKSLEEYAYKYLQPHFGHEISRAAMASFDSQAKLFLRNFDPGVQGIHLRDRKILDRFANEYQNICRNHEIYDGIQNVRSNFYNISSSFRDKIIKLFNYNNILQSKFREIIDNYN